MTLKKKLRMIWDTTTYPAGETIQCPNRRYIAKAFSEGRTGWGVYDRVSDRFILDSEVRRLTVDQLSQDVGLA